MKRDEIPGAALTVCRTCNAPIIRAVSMSTGKPIPVDVTPDPAKGNLRLTVVGQLVQAATVKPALAFGNMTLHCAHFATCPQAARWRTPKRPAKAAPTKRGTRR